MTTKIRIFSKNENLINYKREYENICEAYNDSCYGPNGLYYITDQDDYTHAVILGNEMPYLNISKSRVIGFAMLPPNKQEFHREFQLYAANYIGKYYVYEKGLLGEPFVEGRSFNLHEPFFNYEPSKNKTMSIFMRNARGSEGYKYCHLLVQRILGYNLDIDIYGIDTNIYKYSNGIIDKRFKENTKDAYNNYYFTITLEDYKYENYYTQNLIDPMVNNTMPIYYGCPNLNNYLKDANIISLTSDINSDIGKIQDILKFPSKFYKKSENIKDSQNFIKNIYSMFLEIAEN
jgi:hypothetical protein